jgi:hypothetical protein
MQALVKDREVIQVRNFFEKFDLKRRTHNPGFEFFGDVKIVWRREGKVIFPLL